MQIKLWDVRVTKPVQEYKGHRNEHAYLPVHVCEPEGLLMAGMRGKLVVSETRVPLVIRETAFQSESRPLFCPQLDRIATPDCGA